MLVVLLMCCSVVPATAGGLPLPQTSCPSQLSLHQPPKCQVRVRCHMISYTYTSSGPLRLSI